MKDLKITLLLYRSSASGIATYTVEVAKALSSKIKEVHLCSLGIETYVARELEDRGINILEIREAVSSTIYNTEILGGPFFHYMLLSERVHRVLHQIGILKDADILHYTLTPLALACKGCVVNAWVPLPITEEPRKNWLSFRFPLNILANFAALQYHHLNSLAYRGASKIIAPTRWIYTRLAKKYGKITYIPPPIEIVTNIPSREKDLPTILFVARDLELPRKNVNNLLKSTRILANKGLKFRVLLIGSYSTKFHETVSILSKKTGIEIELVRYIPRWKVHKYYANSDIFVLPSFYEELGYIVLEAMAHGLPLIVSDIPTFRDFVHNGVNGFLVDPFDSEILASKLELLITDNRLRKRMAQKSIEIAKTNFSPQIIADMLVRSYEEIING